MGDIIDDNAEQPINERPAGAPEGSVGAEPTADEIKELYEATGVKAPVPTGKAKGRPKTSDVRAEGDKKNGAGSSNSGSAKNDDNKGKSGDASDSDDDDNSGNSADSKGSKDGKDAGKVQDKSGEADKGVRDSKSTGEKDSERGGKDGSELGDERPGEEAHDEGSEEKSGENEEEAGKRPGKSNPAVEARIQKLANEKKAAEERADALEKQLRAEKQAKEQAKTAQEDPEYTVDDFRKVRDREGNIIDLDPERAELAWRRWKDGFDQRAAEREAKATQAADREERESEMTRNVMKKSVEAYDALAGLMDEYPELVSTSGKFDKDFAAEAMPIIQESIEYLPGTEPGNAEEKLPIIVGLKIHPKKILEALKKVGNAKRTLPLNGVNDNVESGSNVGVPHSRSSDPTVHAANELMKELNINKRF